jgi:hypothetical protein
MNSRDFLSVQSWVRVSISCCSALDSDGAHLVLVVRVQVDAALLRGLPVLGHALVDVRLVDDLGDQLRPLADGARVWRRQLGAQDGILLAVHDEKLQQGPDMVHCEAEHHDGRDQEYEDASAHGDGGLLFLGRPGAGVGSAVRRTAM